MRSRIILVLILSQLILPLWGQRDFSSSDITKLVLLGTGNPNPSPMQSGCALLLLVNNTPYIIDFGPGLIRKAAALSPRYGGPLEGFHVKNLKTAFLTHLHSDHTTGYPDLILTPWVMGRDEALKVYGPEGTASMTSNILEAYRDDIHYRVYGAEPANNQGWRVDCKPSEKLVEYAAGADILVHEVYSQAGYEKKSHSWKVYHADHHTSSLELAALAGKSRPGKVVLYHILFWGSTEEDLLREISSGYQGEVIVGRDLDIY